MSGELDPSFIDVIRDIIANKGHIHPCVEVHGRNRTKKIDPLGMDISICCCASDKIKRGHKISHSPSYCILLN